MQGLAQRCVVGEPPSDLATLHSLYLPSQAVQISFVEQVKKALYRKNLSSPAVDGTGEF